MQSIPLALIKKIKNILVLPQMLQGFLEELHSPLEILKEFGLKTSSF